MFASHQPVSEPQKVCSYVVNKGYYASNTRGVGGIRQEKTNYASKATAPEPEIQTVPADLDNLYIIERYFLHN